jgi:hypothetical protein
MNAFRFQIKSLPSLDAAIRGIDMRGCPRRDSIFPEADKRLFFALLLSLYCPLFFVIQFGLVRMCRSRHFLNPMAWLVLLPPVIMLVEVLFDGSKGDSEPNEVEYMNELE